MAKESSDNLLWALLAAGLAWLVPGAGHVLLGRTLRGIVICLCINGLFWAGVAVGGVFTVDPVGQRLWSVAQLATGASGLAAYYRQDVERKAITASIGIPPVPARGEGDTGWWNAYRQAMADRHVALVYPAETVAQSYSGVAGLLNVMCIADALLLGLMGQGGEPSVRRSKPEPRAGEAAA